LDGSAPLTSGEGVTFLHGAAGTSVVWQLQALAFPRARFPDLPGRDWRRHPATLAGLVDGLAEVLASSLVLVGHSLGSAIALTYALAIPGRLRGLVVVGGGARLRVRQDWLGRLSGEGGDEVIAEIVDAFFAPEADPRLKQKTLDQVRAIDRRTVRADFGSADGFDLRDRLGGLLAPVLVICGSLDGMTPPRLSESLHAALPRSELTIVEGAGHMVMLERPRAVNEAIRRFLDTIDAGAS
jgi:pimeloyl-ACP methyl ester carboxylesterase